MRSTARALDLLTSITIYYYLVIHNTVCILRNEVIILDNLTEMLKGVLEGCVLEIIKREETYGYEITRKLNALGFTDVVEGTVYTILLRLEKGGLVVATKRSSELGPPRKFYALTTAGQEQLQQFWKKWEFVSARIEELRGE